ncbi:probable E3 ubiquitin-protein ligase RHA4A [Salvia miltiorrhiza]|uniref:probable E3 ubiquitin-protein ligase RHA4A n=1 Tax=Salvia miltiorrhiza TaxID=226208 RepID=UPI0025ACCECE|nr:probable E3 ubiquitin-protein ligase RHA4A [Salvia miltiorrhiza]
MKSPQSAPSPPHQYPQAIQLKLYQAFIFSIPILFSIILFLLFYLFYLKRRANFSPHQHLLPTTTAAPELNCEPDLKNEVKNKLCQILYDDCMKSRDSLCCVCLGDFELKEEVLQVPACKHIFHVECIRHWLHNHSTCPLCRAPVAVAGAVHHHHHITQESTTTAA